MNNWWNHLNSVGLSYFSENCLSACARQFSWWNQLKSACDRTLSLVLDDIVRVNDINADYDVNRMLNVLRCYELCGIKKGVNMYVVMCTHGHFNQSRNERTKHVGEWKTTTDITPIKNKWQWSSYDDDSTATMYFTHSKRRPIWLLVGFFFFFIVACILIELIFWLIVALSFKIRSYTHWLYRSLNFIALPK